MARSLSPDIDAAIQRQARATGVDPGMLRTFVLIESGGNPENVTGSYKGLLQLSNGEFVKHGGKGQDIFDPDANLAAGAAKLKAESSDFERRYGRPPTAADLYLLHQQGPAGSAAHWANPDGTAWQNVRPYYTDDAARQRGFKSGDDYAKAAIWGNLSNAEKERFGSVDNITSKDFTDTWSGKVARYGGDAGDGSAPVRLAASETHGSAQPSSAMPSAAPAEPSDTGNAKPFSLASLVGPGGDSAQGVPAQATSPATPAQSFFGSLSGAGSSGNASLASLAETPQQKSDEDRTLEQLQGIRMPGGKPIDLSRLAMILQNRQRLGTA